MLEQSNMMAHPNLTAPIGRIFLEWRNVRSLTRKEVYEATGIHYNTIDRLERGVGNPTIKTIEKLAGFYGSCAQAVIELASGYEKRRKIVEGLRIDEASRKKWKSDDTELEWLDSVPVERLLGDEPQAESLRLLIEARRVAS